jgi:hypothetical protein
VLSRDRAGDADHQHGVEVHRGLKHLSTRAFADRHRFACDRRLIERAFPFRHLAIGRHPRAGPQHHQIAGHEIAHRNFRDGALWVASQRGVGAQRHQRLDRMARPAHRPLLQRG